MTQRPYPLLTRAVQSGVDAVTMGPLQDWPIADLKALIEECNDHYEEMVEIIDAHGALRGRVAEQAKLDVLGRCSEMVAVALHVLESKGVVMEEKP